MRLFHRQRKTLKKRRNKRETSQSRSNYCNLEKITPRLRLKQYSVRYKMLGIKSKQLSTNSAPLKTKLSLKTANFQNLIMIFPKENNLKLTLKRINSK